MHLSESATIEVELSVKQEWVMGLQVVRIMTQTVPGI